MQIVTTTEIKEFPLLSRGKVRDMYALSDQELLIVTTDRMSAFDVVMNEAIPDTGVVLNKITLFWMEKFKGIAENHLLASDVRDFPKALAPYADMLEGRAVIVKKAEPLLVECIVRGHITGSGWKDYKATGAVCGYALPTGLVESDKLATPLFTPSTKAAPGEHDENITPDKAAAIIGQATMDQVRDLSLSLFAQGRDYAEARGVIIADTKFEFGLYEGRLLLIDEVMTPDSSRFWPLAGYAPGQSQPSFDKQYLRDWLSAQPWNKQAPPPALPPEVIERTRAKYFEAYAILTGKILRVRG